MSCSVRSSCFEHSIARVVPLTDGEPIQFYTAKALARQCDVLCPQELGVTTSALSISIRVYVLRPCEGQLRASLVPLSCK